MGIAAPHNKAVEKTQKTLNTSHKTNFTENGELKSLFQDWMLKNRDRTMAWKRNHIRKKTRGWRDDSESENSDFLLERTHVHFPGPTWHFTTV